MRRGELLTDRKATARIVSIASTYSAASTTLRRPIGARSGNMVMAASYDSLAPADPA